MTMEEHDSNKPTSQGESCCLEKEDTFRPLLPLTLLLEHQRIVDVFLLDGGPHTGRANGMPDPRQPGMQEA
jgi:hypothetical protein